MSAVACHDAPPVLSINAGLRRVALAGNPNAGKTTVFNLLTGQRARVGNYPGVTVERKVGRLIGEDGVEILDLPGTYSLNPKSPDEQIAYDVLAGRFPGERAPDLAVCVIDATNLERNLYLASQVMDLGIPTVVVLNMMDEVLASGKRVDLERLQHELGVPVVGMSAAKKKGVSELRALLTGSLPEPAPRGWALSGVVQDEVDALADHLLAVRPETSPQRCAGESLRALCSDRVLAYWQHQAPQYARAVEAARERLHEARVPFEQAEIVGRYGWLRPLAADVVQESDNAQSKTTTERIDAVLTHRVFGPILFAVIMLVVFQSIFTWATPAMDLIEASMTGLGSLTRAVLPQGFVADLLVDGIIAGVGSVLVFLPQILLLFFFLGLMENTGYMARTAFIMDRLMRRVGLTGGSVVPMMSSFACAIPGIMAARTMENHRDRVLTIMVVPLMSCSARLPVYTLFIGAFIPAVAVFGPIGYQGLAMFGLYALGTVMAFLAAWVLSRVVKTGPAGFFMLELPPYRAPQWKLIFWRMGERAKSFVLGAGKVILLCSILFWFMASYPKVELPAELQARRASIEGQIASLPARQDVALGEASALESQRQALDEAASTYRIRHSIIGTLGSAVQPVMAPLGFDWKLTSGVIAAFAAREVIVSALGTLYSVGDADENSVDLREHLRTDRDPTTGELTYTPLVAASLLVFFVLALQCMSTLAVAKRELDSWKYPAIMWVYMTGLAYAMALLVYQGGLALGYG